MARRGRAEHGNGIAVQGIVRHCVVMAKQDKAEQSNGKVMRSIAKVKRGEA